jgi:flagellar hook assembly protein FlgD
MRQVSPNPFVGVTEIAYEVPVAGAPLTVSVHNVAGQVVRVLHDGPAPAARGALVWDGRDESGGRVGSGTYFCRARSGAESALRKIVLVR